MDLEDAILLREHLAPPKQTQFELERMPEAQNVIVNAHLGARVDQFALMNLFPATDFKAGTFPALSLRIRPPGGGMIRLFEDGMVTALGTPMVEDIELGLQFLRRLLIKHGYDQYTMHPVCINNIVYSYWFPFSIRIHEVNHRDRLGFTFIPDLFPGLIYRMISPRVTLLIFETGSLMVLGAKDYASIVLAVNRIRPVLEQHSFRDENTGTAVDASAFDESGASMLEDAPPIVAKMHTEGGRRGKRPRRSKPSNTKNTSASEARHNQAVLDRARQENPERFRLAMEKLERARQENPDGVEIEKETNDVEKLATEVTRRISDAWKRVKNMPLQSPEELQYAHEQAYQRLLKRDKARLEREEKKRAKAAALAEAEANPDSQPAKRRRKAPAAAATKKAPKPRGRKKKAAPDIGLAVNSDNEEEEEEEEEEEDDEIMQRGAVNDSYQNIDDILSFV